MWRLTTILLVAKPKIRTELRTIVPVSRIARLESMC